MRQAEAAKKLGIAPSTLKHVCRKLGVGRWPWRDQKYKRDKSATESAGGCAGGAAVCSSPPSPAAAAGGHVDDAQRYAEYLQSLGGPAGGERPAVRPRPTDASAARDDGQAGGGHRDGDGMLLPRVQAKTWEVMDSNSRGLLDEALESI
jgi:hypothetical protein